MIGLVLVVAMLVIAVFADFFAPMDPNDAEHLASRRPTDLAFRHPGRLSSSLLPYVYPIVELDGQLDPVTFQPLTGPD